jgi:hypothetical protein
MFQRIGYVYLGPDFEDVLPPVLVPADKATGRGEHTFRGCTNDPVIVKLFCDFDRATANGTFLVGPVDIPAV